MNTCVQFIKTSVFVRFVLSLLAERRSWQAAGGRGVSSFAA